MVTGLLNVVEQTLLLVLQALSMFLFARLIIEILVQGNIIRGGNVISSIHQFLFKATEPMLMFVRSKLPPAPVDISYIVTFLGLWLLRILVSMIF